MSVGMKLYNATQMKNAVAKQLPKPWYISIETHVATKYLGQLEISVHSSDFPDDSDEECLKVRNTAMSLVEEWLATNHPELAVLIRPAIWVDGQDSLDCFYIDTVNIEKFRLPQKNTPFSYS